MIDIKYLNFVIRTVNSNITINNYFMQDYNVYSADNRYMFTMYRSFISMPIAVGLCSGNTEKCIAAIKAYAEHVKYHMETVKHYNDEITLK